MSGVDASDDLGLGATMRGLYQLLGQCRNLRFRHIKGHTDQAGNELADAIAFAQCSGACRGNTPQLAINPLAKVDRSFMQWIFVDNEAVDRPKLGNHHIEFSTFEPATSLPFTWRPGEVCRSFEPCTLDVNVNIVSYNIMTGRKHGTIALLKQQLLDRNIHIAGFQETRDRQSTMWPGTPYIRFCSQADSQGGGGLQLWISTQQPFATCAGKKVTFTKRNFTVTVATPRILIVQAHCSSIHWAFVVAHAPHSLDPAAVDWWHEFSKHLATIPTSAHKVLMIDSNARMQHYCDPHCGDHGANPEDKHDDCSDCFHQCLINHDLVLPSTLPVTCWFP